MEQSLSVRGLSIDIVRDRYRRQILSDINIDVYQNRVLGILGEGGSGKTTLAKAMAGWVSPPLQVTAGGVFYNGGDIFARADQRAIRAAIGFIGADPGNAFDPTLPVGEQIAEKLRAIVPNVDRRQARERVIELLDSVRIPSARGRYFEYPSQYSGGMLQRAVIVDALIGNPKVLICDNMLQSLDVTVAAQIVRILSELKSRISSGIVFISTSIASIAEIADEIKVLAGGEIVEQGETRAIVGSPANPATRRLVEQSPRIWSYEDQPAGDNDRDGDNSSGEEPILRVDAVTKTYRKKARGKLFDYEDIKAVRGVSFDVFGGENVGLVGESGCGKSTLSRLLSWVEEPDSGTITFEGRELSTLNRKGLLAMRRGLQLLLQDPYNCLPPNLPIGESIGFALKVHKVGRKERAERVRHVMNEVGLPPDVINALPVGMSAGQRQRVNIARALVLRPRLLILDETLSSLDPVEQGQLLALFERLQARHNLTYVFISHDLAMVRQVCTRTAVMYLGKVVEVADTRGIFGDPGHPYTRALLSAVPSLDEGPFRREEYLLDGEPPDPINLPPGCSFRTRCPIATEICETVDPALTERRRGRFAACHHAYGS